MILARVLSKIYKEDGIILIDSKGQKYICGNPRLEKPITLKLFKESLGTKLILFPEIAFPEAYMNEELIIENGSLREFILGFVKNLGRTEVSFPSLISKKIYGIWRTLTNFNFPGRSKKNVEYHYDVGGSKGEKLYDLFLDKNLRQYSMAMWFDDTKTLEEAQQNKVNHIIKKLDIKPGMRVLDVGCGWGGLAFEMAKQKGCEVLGITLSENQLNYCKKKAKELNLDNQVKFEIMDYRNVTGSFDRCVSVGAFEHFGRKFYNIFFKKINEVLKEDGIFLLHTIGVVDKPSPANLFIQKYIFPGGVCPSLSQVINPIEKTGLIVNDIETLIRHYDKTLESWLKRFLANRSKVKDLFGEKFVKCYEYYMASCEAAFKYRDLVVFQLQIVKNFNNAKRTRNYLYS